MANRCLWRMRMAVLAGLLTLGTAQAQDPAVARAQALEALSALTTNDPQGWFAPPKRSRQVTGTEDVQVTYSKKTVQEAIWEYETVEVYHDVREGDSAGAATVRKKVTERRPVRQTGTREVEKLVRDPNGSITQTEQRPVYGPGGPDVWRLGNLGHNALMAVALLRAGADPASAPLAAVLENLREHYSQYGLPDTTWELGWSAIAFARAGGIYRPMAQEAASKLLDGQISEGPGAGLWGPVCINTKLLAALVEEQTRLSDDFLKAKAELARNKSAQQRMDDAQAALHSLEPLIRQVSSTRLAQPIGAFLQFKTEAGVTHLLPALPHYIYNQTSIDLDSTAIAVMALRVAVETKTMPTQLSRPKRLQWQRLGPPPAPAQLLSRTFRTILAAQQKDGTWTQMNHHQPVQDFVRIKGLEGVPVKADTFVPLPSATTAASTAQGYATLVNLVRMLGANPELPARLRAAEAALQPQLDQLVAGTLGEAAGGLVPPYETVFWLSETPWGGTAEQTAALRTRLENWLAAQQGTDGLWSGKPGLLFIPTSLAERAKLLPATFSGKPGTPPLGVAHSPWSSAKGQNWNLRQCAEADPKVLASAYALYALGQPAAPAATTPPK